MLNFLLILNIFFTTLLNTNELYSKKIYPDIENFKKEYHRNKKDFLYKVNGEEVRDLIKKSDKPWKIVYYYSTGCEFSKRRLDKLIDIWYKNKDYIDIFIISAPNKKDYNKFIDSTKILKYPVFVIDNDLYGDVPYEYNRLFSFTQDLDTEGHLDLKKIFLGGFTLYDGEGNMKISTAFFNEDENTDEKIIPFTEQLFIRTKQHFENINK